MSQGNRPFVKESSPALHPAWGFFAGLLPEYSCCGAALRARKPPDSTVLPVAQADSHVRRGRLMRNLRWQQKPVWPS